MASFDDLQFAGFSGATTAVHCPLCNRIYDLPPTATSCPNHHTLPINTHNPLIPHNRTRTSTQPATATTPASSSASPSTTSSAGFIDFPALAGLDLSSLGGGGANTNFLAMLAAQQNLNMDDLIQSLLNEPTLHSTPTSPAYLSQLTSHPLTPDDFTQLALRVQSVDRDVLPVQAEFGRRVRDSKAGTVAAEGEEGEEKAGGGRVERQVSGRLVMAEPSDGAILTNPAQLNGNVALLTRGRITFVDKCRAVQHAGALLAIVQQTDDTWPYRMTDQSNSGGDIDIPCLLISRRDGDIIRSAITRRQQSADGGGGGDGLTVDLLTRDRQLACPVCRDDFTMGENVIKLPCTHAYHSPCIVDWLKQRNLCPLCRYVLPTEGKKLGEEQQAEAERKQLREAMFT